MTAIKGDYFQIEKDLITIDSCQSIKKSFYSCVIEKKNELTKTLPNEEWRSYLNHFDNLQLACAEETQVKTCTNFFTFYDINY